MSSSFPIGIDLGTTRCVVATLAPQLRALALGQRGASVPSQLFFHEGGRRSFGEEATPYLLEAPERGAFLFKRRMGQPHWYLRIDEQEWSALELSALLLRQLKTRSESLLSVPLHEVLITVPAYFEDSARRDTLEAARQADWSVLGLINEPTAAAIAHAYLHADGLEQERIVVFDLGGGTLDVTVLSKEREQFYVLTSVGDTRLGGQDWDDALAWRMAQVFFGQYHWDPLDEPRAFEALRRACQRAREALTFQEKVTFSFSFEGQSLTTSLTRRELEQACAPFVARCAEVLQQALEEAGWEPSQVERVVLAGGGSRMPMVQQRLSSLFGRALDLRLDPESAVAMGAALRAQQLLSLVEGKVAEVPRKFLSGRRVREVSAHPLSFLMLRDGHPVNRLVIPRNTPLPAETVMRGFTTSRDGQDTLEVYLMQSDAVAPSADDLFDAYVIEGIPPRMAGEVHLELTFRYGLNALVELEARQLPTGEALSVAPLPQMRSLLELLRPPPRDVLLAIDCSASMKGKPILEAKLAAYEFLKELRPEGLRVGLLSFGDPDVKLRVSLQQDTLLIRGYLSELQAMGTTPLRGALEKAWDEFSRPRWDAPQRERILLLLTDGHPEEPEGAKSAASLLHENGVRIVTVGIGNEVDTVYLREHICTYPSDLRSVGDPVELTRVFLSLASELSGGGGALAKWNPNPESESKR